MKNSKIQIPSYKQFSIFNFQFSKFVIWILFVSWSLFLVPSANAQQVSLSLSPPLIELFIKPDKSIMVAYKLENFGDPTFLNLKVLPFEAKNNLGNIRIKPEFEGPVRFSLDNSDLGLDQPFFLKTNSSQQILLRIRIPENITDGDYYYTLLAEATPPTASEGVSSARVKATIGSNILVSISNTGRIDIKPKITLFSTRGGLALGPNIKFFDSSDKIPVILTVANKGKNLMKPEGQISLKGIFGETAKYDIISKNILAESERLLEATPSAEIGCDNRTDAACRVSTSLVLSGFFVGKYTLSTEIKFGEISPNIFAFTTFYAFPFKILAGILLSIIIVLFILKRRRDNN